MQDAYQRDIIVDGAARGFRLLKMMLSEIVEAALERYRAKPKAGFSDCLMLEVARTAGHLPFGTFDKALARRDDATLLA